MRSNSQMDLHQSPIKIVCNVNIPDIGTPINHAAKSNFSANSNKSTHGSLQTRRAEIVLLKDAMQYQLAFQKVNELIRNYPRDLRTLQLKAEITFLMKQYTIAIQIYQQLLDSASSYENLANTSTLMGRQREYNLEEQKKLKALYLYNKALCLQKLNRATEAIQSLKESIEINKHRLESYVLLAELYKQQRNLQKTYKIYRKIIQKNKKSEHLIKVLHICHEQKTYQEMLTFAEVGLALKQREGNTLQNQQLLNELLRYKGQALKKLKRYEEAIQIYLRIIEGQLNETKLVKIYRKLAICYDFTGNLPKACEYYKKILLINETSIQTINNLANLEIRRKHYMEAVNILNSGLSKSFSQPGQHKNFVTSLLRSHRVIAFASLGLIAEAKQDLNEIIKAMKESRHQQISHQEDWQNFKFMRSIVQKYQVCSQKINCIKSESHNDFQEVIGIEKELVCSISESLVKPYTAQTAKNNLEELSSRIDRLYSEIVAFKKSTLAQHQQNASKVHNKIAEIEEMLNKKEEDTLKLEQQLQQLKQENENIYNYVLQLKQTGNTDFSALIAQLKKENKLQIAAYLQNMYWTFNVYFISIRLVANGLLEGNKNIHLNKVSSFFAKFKKIFQTVSKLPHIGLICDIITSVISIYLTQESDLVYKTLNEIITKGYCGEKELQLALQSTLVNLAKSSYIQDLLKNEKSCIVNQMNVYNKAREWFRNKRDRVIEKIFKVECDLNQEERFIKQNVIEDVSATFVYLIKNKQSFLKSEPKKTPDVLLEAIDIALVQGFKKTEISGLYAKQTGKNAQKEKQIQGCSKCIIYKVEQQYNPLQINIPKNRVMNELIAQALEQNNIQLLLHAAEQLTFTFH